MYYLTLYTLFRMTTFPFFFLKWPSISLWLRIQPPPVGELVGELSVQREHEMDEASVQSSSQLRRLPHYGDPRRVSDLRLLLRVSHLRAPEAVQGLGLPGDAGAGASFPHHQVCREPKGQH